MEKLPKSNHYNRDPHNQDFCLRTKDLPMQNSPYWSTESCLVCKEFGVSCASNIKWKISPLALRVSYCCVLKNCRHSHRQPCFPYDLFVAGRNNIHHPLPSAPSSHTQECDFSTIFSNFQTLLAAFFPHNRYILTNLATFLKKALAIVQLEDVSSTAPRARAMILQAQCHPSRRLFWAVSGRETALSVGRIAADSSVNHLQNSVSKHLSLTDCLDF